MFDHLLTFFVLGCIQILMTVWGGIVSVKSLPDGENKTLLRLVFWALGILAVLFTAVIGYQTYKDQKEDIKYKAEATDSQQKIQAKLDDAKAAQDTMNGELLTYAAVLGQMKDSNNVGSKELAAALYEVLHKNAQIASSQTPSATPNTAPQPAPQPVPQPPIADQTKALKAVTYAWTKEVNDWADARTQEGTESSPTSGVPGTTEDWKKAQAFHDKITQEWAQNYRPMAAVFLGQYSQLHLLNGIYNVCYGNVNQGPNNHTQLATYRQCAAVIQNAADRLN